MGFLKDLADKAPHKESKDALTGVTGAKAAERGAQLQADVSREGIALQRETGERIRADLAPYSDAGRAQLPGLSRLVSDPNAQAEYIQNNPFFNAIAERARNDVFANQAARGKLGSGGTPQFLQDRLLQSGNALLQQGIQNRFTLAGMGQNAAAMQGAGAQETGNNITSLLSAIGDSQAAGGIAAANSLSQGSSNIVTGLAAFLCDRRFKHSIIDAGTFIAKSGKEYAAYLFKYVGCDEWVHGLMSDEVEKINPLAVADVFGVKYIVPGNL